jgi:hypothetical protein
MINKDSEIIISDVTFRLHLYLPQAPGFLLANHTYILLGIPYNKSCGSSWHSRTKSYKLVIRKVFELKYAGELVVIKGSGILCKMMAIRAPNTIIKFFKPGANTWKESWVLKLFDGVRTWDIKPSVRVG